MRIYLDSNIFRDLEKDENKELYDLILLDKERNYYCFSEAHIQDLVRDFTEKKISDMDFMEKIVSNNCWSHADQKMHVSFRTPREYYNDYHWNVDTDIMTSEDTVSVLIRESFRAIPLNWNELIDQSQLPADLPEDMRAMLLEPVTMLDFMEAMLNMAENLTVEQPRFKQLLQYLHGAMGEFALYENFGIQGFNGKEVTDWIPFSKSFRELIYQRSTQKDLYSLISEMLFCLDIFGIVKGKPRKQKFMSLLNDGKHVYYAAHAHILVTSDLDMIAKAKMVYRIWGWSTNVMTITELKDYLKKRNLQDLSVAALFEQFNTMAELPTGFEKYTLEEAFVQKDLPNWYLGEFNSLNCATSGGNSYFYFSHYFQNIDSGTMTIELERVVNQLVNHFGIDELNRGKLEMKELEDKEWQGREWRVGQMGVLLNINQGIIISFFKAAPLVNELLSS